MYGDNYGYRSGLNQSMVNHLNELVTLVMGFRSGRASHEPLTVLDIGGNDGTLLKAYPSHFEKILVDPTAPKWMAHYVGTSIQPVPHFFDSRFVENHGEASVDIITSIAMLYDLENPREFMRDIAYALKPTGVWLFEQSHLPQMLKTCAYDTICHEHLEYYSLKVIMKLLDEAGLEAIHAFTNDTNGGSFGVVAAHKGAKFVEQASIDKVLAMEKDLDKPSAYINFKKKVELHRTRLIALIEDLNNKGHTVAGLGASTKFNVLLQYCGFTQKDIGFIIDVNPFKDGRFTPGSLIPIVNEEQGHAIGADYLLVGPWHFKKGIIEREKEFLKNGGALIFPLPDLEIVTDCEE